LTVHSNCSIEAPRSSRIVLKASVTTCESSEIMNDATEVSASTQVFSIVALSIGRGSASLTFDPRR
jgi:hypothetical protein